MPGPAAVVGGILAAEGVRQIERKFDTAADAAMEYLTGQGDGGSMPRSRKRGKVAEASGLGSRKRLRIKFLSPQAKANYAYRITRALMPRMKKVSYTMFNDWYYEKYDGTVLAPYNSKDALLEAGQNNNSTAMHYIDFSHAAAIDMGLARQIIPSGAAMTVDTANSTRNMVFPLGHINLIKKGDNQDQRLGDFCDIRGIHIRGMLRAIPIVYQGATRIVQDLVYDANGDNQAARWTAEEGLRRVAAVRPPPTVKVRMLVVEVLAEPDPEYCYADTEWPYNGLAAAHTQQMTVHRAPLLGEILHVYRDEAADGNHTYKYRGYRGRWLDIDRKYRRGASRTVEAIEPHDERRVEFKVLQDVSFNLKGRPTSLDAREYRGQGSTDTVYIDKFIKLDRRFTYETRSSEDEEKLSNAIGAMPATLGPAAQPDEPSNTHNPIYVYLFSDMLEKPAKDDAGVDLTVVSDQGLGWCLGDYHAAQAHLEADIFFTDGL